MKEKMVSQQKLHFLFPILAFLLLAFPSLVYNEHLSNHPNVFKQRQQEGQSDSSLSQSASEVNYDTKSFEQDTVPAAFDWSSGASIEISYLI